MPSVNFKYLSFIIGIVFLAYSPIFFNGFILDDHLFNYENTYYKSWNNLPRLFQKDCITQGVESLMTNGNDKGPAFTSYRPFQSLTYFIDYSLWGDQSLGYHLTNILIHCLNCILVYKIIIWIFGDSFISLFTALLFGLHPIQSEAVAVMSYRVDLIATFFILLSFYAWLKFQKGDYAQKKYYLASLVAYFLALFTKESSIVFPVMLFLYDYLLTISQRKLRHKIIYYLGFLPILFFYIWVYIFVFPNSCVHWRWLGGNITTHLFTMGSSWVSYCIDFFTPWRIHLIPTTYMPSLPSSLLLGTLKITMALIILGAILFRFWRSYKLGAFFLLWSLIFYIPVSNLIPLANPVGYRFMYLPSLGILTLGVFLLFKILFSDRLKEYSQRLAFIVLGGVLAGCFMLTVFLNTKWKDDFTVANTWLEHFPSSTKGLLIKAEVYYYQGMYQQAKIFYLKGYNLGDRNPFLLYHLGKCFLSQGELEKAKACFLELTHRVPKFLDAYILLKAVENQLAILRI